MKFLRHQTDTHNKYIVKLSVIPKNQELICKLDQFVFVFSEGVESSSAYAGDTDIELVPVRSIPIFHENLPHLVKREIKDEEFAEGSVRIGSSFKITKDASNYRTNYVVEALNRVTGEVKRHLLLTRNRGEIGKLENMPPVTFSPDFQHNICDYETERAVSEIETSIKHVRELDGDIDCLDQIVAALEQKKSKVQAPTVADCLRSFQQRDYS